MEKKVISVIGYNSCGYYHRACDVAKNYVAKNNNLRVVCKAWDRTKYKQWLSEQHNNGIVDTYHTSSPATFFGDVLSKEDKTEFIGGCDELTSYVRSQEQGGNDDSSNNGCKVL
jgi:hypothetical protein